MFFSGSVALRTARVEAADTPAYTASIIGEGQTRKQIGCLSAWRAWSNVGGTVFRILSLEGVASRARLAHRLRATWKMTPVEKSVKTRFLYGLAAAQFVATHPVSA